MINQSGHLVVHLIKRDICDTVAWWIAVAFEIDGEADPPVVRELDLRFEPCVRGLVEAVDQEHHTFSFVVGEGWVFYSSVVVVHIAGWGFGNAVFSRDFDTVVEENLTFV